MASIASWIPFFLGSVHDGPWKWFTSKIPMIFLFSRHSFKAIHSDLTPHSLLLGALASSSMDLDKGLYLSFTCMSSNSVHASFLLVQIWSFLYTKSFSPGLTELISEPEKWATHPPPLRTSHPPPVAFLSSADWQAQPSRIMLKLSEASFSHPVAICKVQNNLATSVFGSICYEKLSQASMWKLPAQVNLRMFLLIVNYLCPWALPHRYKK